MNETEKGRAITNAFLYIRKLFDECQSLIFKIDNQLAPEWTNLYGNRITRDVSASLQDPGNWILQAIYRMYENKEDKLINKGITISFWDEEDDIVQQPIIIAGKIIYSDLEKRDHWDLWRVWFEWEDHSKNDNNYELDGKINIFQSEECSHIKEAPIFAWPLVSISDEKALMEKIINPLKQL